MDKARIELGSNRLEMTAEIYCVPRPYEKDDTWGRGAMPSDCARPAQVEAPRRTGSGYR